MPRGYVTTGLGQIHYTRQGVGQALLLLGASGRSARMFAPLATRLAGSFDVIAPDAPGFGNSDPMPPGASIEDIAAACVEVMDALGLTQVDLYGHHSGNKIAVALAVRFPARVRRLILIGQSHSLIPDQARRNGTILGIVRDLVAPRSGETAALAEWAAAWQRLTAIWWERDLVAAGAPEDAREAARLLALDELQSGGTAALYGANFRYDLGADYPRIGQPTLVIEVATPEEDRSIGRQGPTVQALIPGAALATLHEPAGFTLTLENRAADLATLIRDWLLPPPPPR